MLKCGVCGAIVTHGDDGLERTCDHAEAPVIAEMKAEAKGSARLR